MTTFATNDLKALMPLINAARATARKNLLHDCLLVSADDNGLHVKTPLKLYVTIGARGELPCTVVSHKAFAAAVRSCGKAITLSRDDEGLVVESDGITLRLEAKPDDYAELMHGERCENSSLWFIVPGDALAAAIDATAIAVSTEETRYYLNGVYLHTDGASIAAVATDGHRLVKKTFAASVRETKHTAIVPREALPALRRLCRGKRDIEVYRDGERIIFNGQDGVMVVRFIDGIFPDYEKVIPPTKARVTWIAGDASELMTAARAIMPRAKDSIGTCVVVDATSTAPTMATKTATARIAVTASNGKTTPRIGFNVRYLAEMLGLEQGPVRISFHDHASPAVFDGADATLTRVLMPMRI